MPNIYAARGTSSAVTQRGFRRAVCTTGSVQQLRPILRDLRGQQRTIGVVIRFPIFSSVQRAHAQAADAEAVKSKRQAEAAKNQVSEETLKQQRAVRQMGCPGSGALRVRGSPIEPGVRANPHGRWHCHPQSLADSRGQSHRTLHRAAGHDFRTTARPHWPVALHWGTGKMDQRRL